MKAKEFLARLKPALAAAEARTTIPVIACIKLGDGRAVATDMDLWASVSLPEADFSPVCVNASKLQAALGSFEPDGDVILAVDGDRLTLKCGRRRASIATLPADEFPEMDGDDWSWTGAGDEIVAALVRVSVAASTEETRYYLNGAAINAGHAVATDGHRLLATPIPVQGDLAAIVPTKALRLFARLGDGITLRLAERCIEAETAGVTITSQLIDGSYPDWQRVVPTGVEHRATVDAAALAGLARAASWANDDVARTIKLTIGDGTIEASGTGALADSACTIDAETGEPLTVGFNGRYVESVAAAFEGEIKLASDGEAAPMLITGGDMRAVIMPMRIAT